MTWWLSRLELCVNYCPDCAFVFFSKDSKASNSTDSVEFTHSIPILLVEWWFVDFGSVVDSKKFESNFEFWSGSWEGKLDHVRTK